MPIDRENIHTALKRVLPANEASEWSQALKEDMDAAGVFIEANPASHRQLPIGPLAYYVPGTNYGPGNLRRQTDETRKAAGFMFDVGNVAQLAKVCQIGRRFLGPTWYKQIEKNKLIGGDHLATVEEFWWLGLWHTESVSDLVKDARPFGNTKGSNVDWQFRCHNPSQSSELAFVINLEVKLRPRDWRRVIYGRDNHPFDNLNFADATKKFTSRNDGHLNVLGVTLLGEVDDRVQQSAKRFVDQSPNIDAVILWTHAWSKNGRQHYIAASRKVRGWLSLFFIGSDDLDRATRVPFFLYPRREFLAGQNNNAEGQP